jgi:hypothetical protein
MVELLRHRQTKEAETDMFSLKPPRHIPTLPSSTKSSNSAYELMSASTPKATKIARRRNMSRMGWTGRAPAPDGSQSAWGACQEQEHRHASQVHRSRSHHHRN